MTESHAFTYYATIRWNGNTGSGTADYRSYERAYDVTAPGKPTLLGSSEPAFRGDASRYNPEDLLVASLSACHMLWFLHLAVEAGIVVTDYDDDAEGVMVLDETGGGCFERVTLRPRVVLAPESDTETAAALHETAHARCFIANSMNFPVLCEPEISSVPPASQS